MLTGRAFLFFFFFPGRERIMKICFSKIFLLCWIITRFHFCRGASWPFFCLVVVRCLGLRGELRRRWHTDPVEAAASSVVRLHYFFKPGESRWCRRWPRPRFCPRRLPQATSLLTREQDAASSGVRVHHSAARRASLVPSLVSASFLSPSLFRVSVFMASFDAVGN